MPRISVTAIGPVFTAMREKRGLRQEALASKAGLSLRVVQKAERGESVDPTTLHILATALGTTFETLATGNSDESVSLEELDISEWQESEKPFRFHVTAPPTGLKLIGRDTNLKAIHGKLSNAVESGVGVVAMHGVPGVGKSTLMSCLCRESSLGRLFPDGGLWTEVGNKPNVFDSLCV